MWLLLEEVKPYHACVLCLWFNKWSLHPDRPLHFQRWSYLWITTLWQWAFLQNTSVRDRVCKGYEILSTNQTLQKWKNINKVTYVKSKFMKWLTMHCGKSWSYNKSESTLMSPTTISIKEIQLPYFTYTIWEMWSTTMKPKTQLKRQISLALNNKVMFSVLTHSLSSAWLNESV